MEGSVCYQRHKQPLFYCQFSFYRRKLMEKPYFKNITSKIVKNYQYRLYELLNFISLSLSMQ